MSTPALSAACPQGHPITAVIEMAAVIAEVDGFDARRLPAYAGFSEVVFDSQQPFAERAGGVDFVAPDHAEARYRCNGGCPETLYRNLRFEAAR